MFLSIYLWDMSLDVELLDYTNVSIAMFLFTGAIFIPISSTLKGLFCPYPCYKVGNLS